MNIKQTILTKSLVLVGILLLGACGGSDDDKPALSDRIDNYLRSAKAGNDSGLAILVRKDSENVYMHTEGLADRNTGVEVTADTGIKMASLTKPFTAMAILQLREQGMLALEDSILDYLPELPESWRPITIHHLLSHQSGILDFLNDLSSINRGFDFVDGVTNESLIDYFILNPELEFTPGSREEYSNTGFVLLGSIIENIVGMSYESYMEQTIFMPIGMVNTYVPNENSGIRPGDALNHGLTDDFFNVNIYAVGSGSQVSSINDFAAFFDAVRNNDIISAESLALMTQVHSPEISYGYGIGIDMVNGDLYNHTGSEDGFKSVLYIYPDRDIQFVVLGNGGQVTSNLIATIQQIIINYYNE